MSARLDDIADVVIVGSGAGGATAARVLASQGIEVAILEEGHALPIEARRRELLDAMTMGMRDLATLTTSGVHPIPLLQGRCVGGSTAINSGIVWRLPAHVRDDWAARFGLEALLEPDELDRIASSIEDELGVGPTSSPILGGNNALMQRAADALGLPGRVIRRNARGCAGNARCLQGCPIGARQSMDVSYIPRALADGARLFSGCRVERVVLRGARAVAVAGSRLDPEGRITGRFEIRARRAVIVAASAIWTPVLLRRSGLRHPLLGERFQAHPGAAFVARFDEPVTMGFGASQGYEIPMHERGFKIEALGLPPELLAARLPGAGERWARRVDELGHYAQWGAQARMEALGRVRPGWFGGAAVHFEPTARDLAKIRDALAIVGRMFFAAGASEIYPGIAGRPEVIRSVAELDVMLERPLARSEVHLVASHLFGTACASAHPDRGVVDPELAVHGAEGLYVMDASVFPTNLGVNPQHSIMTIVWSAAEKLAARLAHRDVSLARSA